MWMSVSAVLGSVRGRWWRTQAGLEGKSILLKSFSYFDLELVIETAKHFCECVSFHIIINKDIENVKVTMHLVAALMIQQVICFAALVYYYLWLV